MRMSAVWEADVLRKRHERNHNQLVAEAPAEGHLALLIDGDIVFDGRTRRGNVRHLYAYWGDSISALVWGMNANQKFHVEY